jgi:hypothetical protein
MKEKVKGALIGILIIPGVLGLLEGCTKAGELLERVLP